MPNNTYSIRWYAGIVWLWNFPKTIYIITNMKVYGQMNHTKQHIYCIYAINWLWFRCFGRSATCWFPCYLWACLPKAIPPYAIGPLGVWKWRSMELQHAGYHQWNCIASLKLKLCSGKDIRITIVSIKCISGCSIMEYYLPNQVNPCLFFKKLKIISVLSINSKY